MAIRTGEAALSAPGERSKTERYSGAPDGEPDYKNWLSQQINQARKLEAYTAQTSLEHPGGRVSISFKTLSSPGHDNRYAVLISPSEDSIPEGASLITRQQWHDIKNHLGGLKLYATFLKKKIPDSEDQAIVEKLLNGINGLIDHLAQIRGGESK